MELHPSGVPPLFPGMKLGGSDPMPREVALVQCEKLPLGQFAESLTVFLGDAFSCPCADSQCRLFLVHAFADDCGNELPKRSPVPHAKRIGFAQRLPNRRVARRRACVGPTEHVPKQLSAIQLVHAQHRLRIEVRRDVVKGKRGKIAFDQRNVRREPRHPLVHVFEWLQMRKMHQREQPLLEGVVDGRSCGEYPGRSTPR